MEAVLGDSLNKYGGLVSLVRMSLPSGDGSYKTALALKVIKSRSLFTEFIQRHDILVPLMAAAFEVNDAGVTQLAQACAVRNIALMQVPTDFVFGGTTTSPWLPIDPVSPLGVYGANEITALVS
jgi:hypothetical protein